MWIMGTLDHVDCVDYGFSLLWRICGLRTQRNLGILYTVDCGDYVGYGNWTMWTIDRVDYGYFAPCALCGIMGILDHVDYGYSGL